ncbi:hypothetical protein EPO34_03710 [Patescibacteria group bacterium]|nr:MAG: hypothetical protein EPO34_03710 [Patescibacteria group bacterium]
MAFVAPEGYAFADGLEALRDAKLSLLLPDGSAYRCRLDVAQHSADRVGGRRRAFGLISTPLPPFRDLPKDTVVLLEDRQGTMRFFPFERLRKTG